MCFGVKKSIKLPDIGVAVKLSSKLYSKHMDKGEPGDFFVMIGLKLDGYADDNRFYIGAVDCSGIDN